jgi:hypothetical protein
LVPAKPGENNGTHRGPDKFPRANVMRAIVLMSLAALGYRVEDLPKTMKELQARRRRDRDKFIPAAAAHLMVQANLRIITEAAMGEREVYGRFLTLQRDFHQIMAGGNGLGWSTARRARLARRGSARRGERRSGRRGRG